MYLLFIRFLLQIMPFSAPNVEHTNVSLMVEDISSHTVVDTFRHRHVTVPASLLKLITTGAALETLGPQFRFATYLEYSGDIADDTLKGNLYIRGTCDPTLGAKIASPIHLEKWVQAVRDAGIKHISGQIIADMSILDGDAYNPAWLFEDVGNYYAPGIYGINYLSNTMNIVLKSANDGSIAEVIRTEPHYDSIQFINQIRCTTTDHDGAFVHSLPHTNLRYLSGSIPAQKGQFGIKGDIPNPGLLLAKHLIIKLKSAGIDVPNSPSFITQQPSSHFEQKDQRHAIYTHLSDPLSDIIAETNINSNNLYAEALFRYLGTLSHQKGTIHNSCLFINNFWKSKGINLREMIVKDGCGLAPQNAVSANAFIKILDYMATSKYADIWFASLAICGKTGTLEPFLKNTPLQGITIAKSGTIASTRNMAGYITLPNGHKWAFAILINGTYDKARRLQKHINNYLLNAYKSNT